MLEIKGKINTAICYASVIEEEAIEQIRRMCDYEFTAGSRIRIMPDVHPGKVGPVGLTATVTDKIIPSKEATCFGTSVGLYGKMDAARPIWCIINKCRILFLCKTVVRMHACSSGYHQCIFGRLGD